MCSSAMATQDLSRCLCIGNGAPRLNSLRVRSYCFPEATVIIYRTSIAKNGTLNVETGADGQGPVWFGPGAYQKVQS